MLKLNRILYVVPRTFTARFAAKMWEAKASFSRWKCQMSLNDKEKVNNFLENQSLNYSCGVDFSEIVSLIDFDKPISRPYCATYSGNLTLSCLHPVDEKIHH